MQQKPRQRSGVNSQPVRLESRSFGHFVTTVMAQELDWQLYLRRSGIPLALRTGSCLAVFSHRLVFALGLLIS
jgi:hypothetical protein